MAAECCCAWPIGERHAGKMKPAARTGSKFLPIEERLLGRIFATQTILTLLENAPGLNNAEFTRQDSVDADIASVRQILDPRKFFENATPLSSDAGEDAR